MDITNVSVIMAMRKEEMKPVLVCYMLCAVLLNRFLLIKLSVIQILTSVQLVPVAVMSMLTALTLLVGITVPAKLDLLELGELVLQVCA